MENQNIDNQQKMNENIPEEQVNGNMPEHSSDGVEAVEAERESIASVDGKSDAFSQNGDEKVEADASEEDSFKSSSAEEFSSIEHAPAVTNTDRFIEGTVKELESETVIEKPVEEATETESEVMPEKKKKKDDGEVEATEEDEDEYVDSFFKTKKWQRIWDKICLVLLLLVILVPVGLLAYIILSFFL